MMGVDGILQISHDPLTISLLAFEFDPTTAPRTTVIKRTITMKLKLDRIPTSQAPSHPALKKSTCLMSLTRLPPRARCIQITDRNVTCQCPWFNAPSVPSLDHVGSLSIRPLHLTLQSSQFSCVDCGHGIHAHVDYESKVVFHNPTTHCAAYAQKVTVTSLHCSV